MKRISTISTGMKSTESYSKSRSSSSSTHSRIRSKTSCLYTWSGKSTNKLHLVGLFFLHSTLRFNPDQWSVPRSACSTLILPCPKTPSMFGRRPRQKSTGTRSSMRTLCSGRIFRPSWAMAPICGVSRPRPLTTSGLKSSSSTVPLWPPPNTGPELVLSFLVVFI